jgi:hypothetical protein
MAQYVQGCMPKERMAVECSGGLIKSVWVNCVLLECCDGTGGQTYSSDKLRTIKPLQDCVLEFKLDVLSMRVKNWHSGECLALGMSTLPTANGRKRGRAPTAQPADLVNPHHLGVIHNISKIMIYLSTFPHFLTCHKSKS